MGMTTKVVRRLTIWSLLFSSLALLPARSEATIFPVGEIEFTGNFTLTPAYNFNAPNAQPFGTFGTLTTVQATGIFGPFVKSGDVLGMDTPNLLSGSLAGQPMIWSIGGFTIGTIFTQITGADFVGRNVSSNDNLSFCNFDFHNSNPVVPGAPTFFGRWDFIAPPYDIRNFTSPITGPINLTIREEFSDGVASIPEPASFLLLTVGLALLAAWRFRQQVQRQHIAEVLTNFCKRIPLLHNLRRITEALKMLEAAC